MPGLELHIILIDFMQLATMRTQIHILQHAISLREAIPKKKVTKLRTFSVPPLGKGSNTTLRILSVKGGGGVPPLRTKSAK